MEATHTSIAQYTSPAKGIEDLLGIPLTEVVSHWIYLAAAEGFTGSRQVFCTQRMNKARAENYHTKSASLHPSTKQWNNP